MGALHGCSWECGDAVYPDTGESRSVRQATALTQGETGPPLPYSEITTGTGRIAQWGRKLGVRARFRGAGGAALAEVEALFLFPAVDRDRLGTLGGGIDSGEVPVYFGPVLAGMRVGGVRRFDLPGRRGRAAWRVRGIGQSNVTEVPAESAVVTELELVSVCRPRICVTTTYSIPAMRDRSLNEYGCD